MTPYGLFTGIGYGLIGGFVALIVQLAFYVYYFTSYGAPDVRPVIDLPYIISAPVHLLLALILGMRSIRDALSRFALMPLIVVFSALSAVGRYEVVLLRTHFGLQAGQSVSQQVLVYWLAMLICILSGAALAMRLAGTPGTASE